MSRKTIAAPVNDLGTVLSILRTVRGLNQQELAKASGLRAGTLSDYERGKMIAGLNSMQRILAAMGYDLSALDRTQAFIELIRDQQLDFSPASQLPGENAALRQEIITASRDAGLLVARMVKLFFGHLLPRHEQ